MNKLFSFIKEKFINKEFIIFCVIGVLNTIVNGVILNLTLRLFAYIYNVESTDSLLGFSYYLSTGTSIFLAFLLSSIFSYFMNAKFTYNKKATKKNAFYSAIAFVSRFVLTYVFTLLCYMLVKWMFNIVSDPNEYIKTIVNFFVSLILVPPFFLLFNRIFKGKEEIKNN